ncbi:MAG: TRAP transporter substrate-binding protein DctP [Motiliproteus sp.]
MTLAFSAQAADWRYAMEEGLTDPQGMYATKFKEEIEKNSGHTIKIYPVGSLGESSDAMEQAQAGLLQFIDQSPGFTGAMIPEAEAFLVPYMLPTDPQVVHKFFKEGKAINEMFHGIYREHGLELLSVFPEGEQVVTTRKEFRNPAQLKGIKIRTMTSPLLLETYKAFGASPIAMAWGELIGALKTNMVDGQENPAIWIEAYGLDDLTPVLTYTGHAQYTTAVMANADFYDDLSAKDKKLIQDAAAVAHDYILNEAIKMDENGLKKIKETNPKAKIVRLTDAERAVFKTRAKAVEDKFIAKAGERGRKIIEQMKRDLTAASQ